MNKGELLWTVANGNGPRDHPAIKQLNLPPLGQGGRVAPLVTKTMVFLGEGGNDAVVALPPGGGGKMFRAFDKATGHGARERSKRGPPFSRNGIVQRVTLRAKLSSLDSPGSE